MEISFGHITFSSKFDSGNLAHVEQVCRTDDQKPDGYFENVDYTFNLWTSPDASGTIYENGNRTWFYFSISGPLGSRSVKFTIMNMNRQSRLYKQGLTPFFKSLSGRNPSWQRVKEKPIFDTVDGNFQLTFVHKFADSMKHTTTYFAFCYPFSYSDCQKHISNLQNLHGLMPSQISEQDIYFHQDILTQSVDGLNVDLLTVTSMKGITRHYERNLLGLFPDESLKRPRIFRNKKIFFLTSRVHPGETQASYVFNGFLDFILRKNDKRARVLRDLFVFKMVPMLNPDGVKRGHYRTDSFGVNLNRTFIDPDIFRQPTIFALKTLMMYHHFNRTDPKLCTKELKCSASENIPTKTTDSGVKTLPKCSTMPCLNNNQSTLLLGENLPENVEENVDRLFTRIDKFVIDYKEEHVHLTQDECTDLSVYDLAIDEKSINQDNENNNHIDLDKNISHKEKEVKSKDTDSERTEEKFDEGIEFYIDLHGHASKRGCFVYGNYVDQEKDMVECMLYPKLISLNSQNFDFNGCDFNERNMYHKDKRDGLSKEGSGRVSMFKTLGIIHSYTLECNYNTGRTTNMISPTTGDDGRATPPPTPGFPPRYTPEHYEEVGRATAIALLDFYDCNPWSRLPASEYKSLSGVRDWITKYIRNPPAKNFAQAKSIKQNKAVKISQVLQEFRKVTSQTPENQSSIPHLSHKPPLPSRFSPTKISSTDSNFVTSPPQSSSCSPTKNSSTAIKDPHQSRKYPLKLFQRVLPRQKEPSSNPINNSNRNVTNTTLSMNSNPQIMNRNDFSSMNNLTSKSSNRLSSGSPEKGIFKSEKQLEKSLQKDNKLSSTKKLLSCRLSMEKPYSKPRSESMTDEKNVHEEERLSPVPCHYIRSNEAATPIKKKKCSPTGITKKKAKTTVGWISF